MQNEQTAEPAQNAQLGDHMAATVFHSALEVREVLTCSIIYKFNTANTTVYQCM
jgi:hypothetical protein